MASQIDIQTLRKLRGKLLNSVNQINERIGCCSCLVPAELDLIASRLSEHCRERCRAARTLCEKAKSFGFGFLLWAKKNGFGRNIIAETARQLLDCQGWIDVVIYTFITLLVSNEARDACNIPRIMFIEEKTSGICWTHLPRAFTARDVEERLAEVRSRRCLEEYLSISQAERSTTREILTTAGVNLVALEQLVAKILYDSDRSSLIESADECPAPQIPQDEPYMQHHNAYPVIKYEDPVKEPPTVIVLPIENQNEHPLSCEVDKKTRLDIVTYAVPNHVEHEDNSNLQNEAITYFVNTESGRSMITFDPISGFIKVSQIGRSEVYRSPNIPSQRSDKSVIWFGSAHDSDTSTLRMDKSSSIWGSDMDIHWNSEWTRSASVHGSHHEVWVRESYSLMEPIRAHVVPPPNSSLPPPSRLQRTLASSYPLPEVYFPGQNSSYLPPLSASAYYQGSAYPPIPSYPPAPSYSPSINKYFSLNNEFDQRSVRPLSSRFQLSDDNTVKNSAQNTTLNTVPANLSTRHEGVIHEKGRS